jgi:hypothetical protein
MDREGAGPYLFRLGVISRLDRPFNACPARCVGSVWPHPQHAGTDIQLWLSAGADGIGVHTN